MTFTRTTAALCIVAQLAACTTLNSVPDAREPGGDSLKAGDQVQVMRSDGSRQFMILTEVRENEICAKDGCVQRSDISSALRVEPDTRARGWTVWGVVGVVATIALVSALMSAARASAAAQIWNSAGGR